jgi:hypothetical protein
MGTKKKTLLTWSKLKKIMSSLTMRPAESTSYCLWHSWMPSSTEILGTPSLSFHLRKLKPQQACLTGAGAKEEAQLLPDPLPKTVREEQKHSGFFFSCPLMAHCAFLWLALESGKLSLPRTEQNRGGQEKGCESESSKAVYQPKWFVQKSYTGWGVAPGQSVCLPCC